MLKLKRLKKLITLSIPLFLALPAHADIRFNGFMSIGAGMTLDDDEFYVTDTLSGSRYTDDISFKPDSLFALQVSSDLGDGLSATAQLLSSGGNDFDPEFEWAYIKYQINPQWSVQVGRLRAPFFLHSLYLDVGYSYNWVRPPIEVHQASDILKRIEGVDFTWANSYNNWDATVSLTYGNAEVDAIVSVGPAEIEFTDVIGITGQVSYDWLTLRAGYVQNDAATTPVGRAEPFPVNAGSELTTLAAVAEWDQFSIKAEYFQREFIQNIANDDKGFYVTAAYTSGDFTPHITYSTFKDFDTNSDPLAIEDYNSIILGLKYNFHPSAMFKVEYISRSVDTTAEAAVAIIARGATPTPEADVIVVAIDLIF